MEKLNMGGLILKEGRSIADGQRVKVYRNLNKAGYFSICDCKTGLVLGYAKNVHLNGDIKFHVSENSRQRVLRDKRRNVHAYVTGLYAGIDTEEYQSYKQGYYNPYLVSQFVNYHSREHIKDAESIICFDKYVYYL